MRMGWSRFAVPFVFALASGCSASDPGTGIDSYHPRGGPSSASGGGGAGASNAGGPSGGGTTPSTPPPSGTGVPDAPPGDAGGGGTSPGVDAGGGSTGSADAGPTNNATPGTCQNPLCITDGVACGCHATDSQGNKVEIGCQGGQCVCIVNGQVDGQPIDDPNSCDSQSTVKADFLANCTCN